MFDEFWELFPNSVRKHAKGECRIVFWRIVTGHGPPGTRTPKRAPKTDGLPGATAEALIAAVKVYAQFVVKAGIEPQYIPSPVVWLNGGRWLDQPKVEGESERLWWMDPIKVQSVSLDKWREGIRKHANGTWPILKLGPPPGDPHCRVPYELVREMGLDEIYDHNGRRRDGGH